MNMVTINPTVSMTTLSVNGLNTTFKWQVIRVNKKYPIICCL
jgi:hypothetical protein